MNGESVIVDIVDMAGQVGGHVCNHTCINDKVLTLGAGR